MRENELALSVPFTSALLLAIPYSNNLDYKLMIEKH